MRLQVFDRKNTERLLGTLEMTRDFHGSVLNIPLISPMEVRAAYLNASAPVEKETTTIQFVRSYQCESGSRQIDTFTVEKTVVRTTILLTDASLEDLAKLDRFRVAGARYASGPRYMGHAMY